MPRTAAAVDEFRRVGFTIAAVHALEGAELIGDPMGKAKAWADALPLSELLRCLAHDREQQARTAPRR